MPPNPTLGSTLGPWIDDGILVETFNMPNINKLVVKGMVSCSIPDHLEEKYAL